jgi:hypothetical protein
LRKLYFTGFRFHTVCEEVPTNLGQNFPIRDQSDIPILRTAIVGEADFICPLDTDFYTADITAFCAMMGITILDDITLLSRLRS